MHCEKLRLIFKIAFLFFLSTTTQFIDTYNRHVLLVFYTYVIFFITKIQVSYSIL